MLNMNWGWGGDYDNVECGLYSIDDLIAGTYHDDNFIYHNYNWKSTRKIARKIVNY